MRKNMTTISIRTAYMLLNMLKNKLWTKIIVSDAEVTMSQFLTYFISIARVGECEQNKFCQQ